MLFNLINRALKAGVKKIIIADPCRPPFNELTKRCQKKWGEKVEVVEMFLSRPSTASGDILIVTND
ncbi:MAG: hypothetical protein U5O39_07790 [Gammaproteobacteria bacterium]|nr:hypothetical protein [Gammaproteobacteria bacterium]